jgi:hypothetical protein
MQQNALTKKVAAYIPKSYNDAHHTKKKVHHKFLLHVIFIKKCRCKSNYNIPLKVIRVDISRLK